MLGLYVTGGLAASAYVATLTYHWNVSNIWVFLMVGLALPILGIVISLRSSDWIVSTFGYLMVLVPFGAILGPFVAHYEVPSVLQAVTITVIVAGGMWLVGTIIPPITRSWGAAIVGILLVVIAGDVARMLVSWQGIEPQSMRLWDWLVAAIFSGLVVYDVNKAQQLPRTLDNAVDSAVGLYLDIINIFVRVLAASGKKSSSSNY